MATVQEQGDAAARSRVLVSLREEIRHRLVMLPYYDVFDWLEANVDSEGSVVLRGQVTKPVTRSDAEARVKRIEGVRKVVNEIEVLPVSTRDDRLRVAVYRALFNYRSPLFRYAIQSVPSIHIVIKGGRATLKGVVANESDSRLAYIKARGVGGLFAVVNELKIESSERK
jgi:hyperosmotically inducible protein